MPETTILRCAFVHRTGFQLPEDTYEGTAILAPLEGAFAYEIAGAGAGEARFGDLVFCPPGGTLRRRALTPTLTFVFAEFTVAGEAPAGHVRVGDTRRLASTLDGFRRHGGPWRTHLLRDLLYLCADSASSTPATVADPMAAEAARQLSEGEGTLQELSSRLGLSPSQLTRRFTAAYGVGPAEYRASLRLERARRLLLETDWTLERIADACGFRDGFYLSRVFSRRMRMPPSEYRRAHRV